MAAGVGVLALAPGASAAFRPLFTATSAGNVVTVSYSQPAADDGAASLVFYAPAAYVAKLAASPGSVVGTATGTAIAADIRGSTMPLDGTIRAAAPSTPVASSCAGSGAPAAVWALTLGGFDESIPLTIGVQKLDSGPMAGGVALSVCPPAADLPVGTTGRSPLGMKIVHLTLKLTNAFAVPAGTHVWHLKATPYTPGSAQPNAAGAAEAEAEHAAPERLTLAAKAAGAKRSDVSGRLTLAGKGVAGRTVRILAGGKQVGTAKTNAAGDFAASVKLKRTPATLVAKVVVPARYGACATPAFAPLPCTTSIAAGFATTAHVRVSG
jgi:hypothetical protein